ncbi:MAG TPA: 50S ribosomal protein L29 [Methylomirabilota bacterium]|nr:50S ribosomal protein L29 [Methylomirabilota bacterium]
MKAAKWRDLSEDEVRQKMRELTEEVFNLRFQLSMGVTKNPSRLSQARRDLARGTTILAERGGSPRSGNRPSAPGESPAVGRTVAEPTESPAVGRRKLGGRTSRAGSPTARRGARTANTKTKKRG